MEDKIKIDIFSGFFGAGKTTLIKKLIDEDLYNKKVVIIENEFGEIGIDGIFLEKYNIEVKEINAGCICCSTFNDFNNTIQDIIDSNKIKRIIIEPSGVGKLSEILDIVKKFEIKNNVIVNMVTTVVDVTMYEDFIGFFSEFYKDQIIYASTIVLSRTQSVNYEELQNVVSKIKTLNKKANIITTPWDVLSGNNIIRASEKNGRQELFNEVNIIKIPKAKVKAKFRIARKILAEDIFSSWVIETPKVYNVEELKLIFNNLKDEKLYGKIVRAKGVLQVDENKWIQFDYLPKQCEVREVMPDYTGRICVIGINLNIESLINIF
ncbi:GTP-binding protein [Clostridium estertheticum]|uniref:CobW family GTP-binding protein n=1 Tax=Clostridium estertheticum TaxID=238834 RepID=UPI001C0B6D5B|nr:GTP-binding protein [Clostridium estertheticum]MBU3177706.1 GTP-binding protein [Clostridium estertheticum]